MRSKLFSFVLLLTACTTGRQAAMPPSAVPDNALLAQQAVDAVLWQHCSAEAKLLFLQGYELARMKLDANLARRSPADTRPPAVIVDVDETVLDNSLYEVERIAVESTYDSASWAAWTARVQATALPGAVAFLKYAEQRGCAVFYITNRSLGEKQATVYNLRAQGFPMADDDHVRCMEGSESNKSGRRAKVAADYAIMLLVGDQLRDFSEDFKDRSADHGRGTVDLLADTLDRYFVLLPNPIYGTWRDAISGKGTDAEKAARIRLFFREYAP